MDRSEIELVLLVGSIAMFLAATEPKNPRPWEWAVALVAVTLFLAVMLSAFARWVGLM